MSFRASSPEPETRLELCPMCTHDFVNPVEWEPVDSRHWWMLLRCGECETWSEVTVTNADAERFDVELDRRTDLLTRALNALDRERMAAQVETFVVALRRGLFDAADFAR